MSSMFHSLSADPWREPFYGSRCHPFEYTRLRGSWFKVARLQLAPLGKVKTDTRSCPVMARTVGALCVLVLNPAERRSSESLFGALAVWESSPPGLGDCDNMFTASLPETHLISVV